MKFFSGLVWKSRFFFGILLSLSNVAAYANVNVSIRVQTSLKAYTDQVNYIARISDCTQVVSTEITAGDSQYVFSPAEGDVVTNNPIACEHAFIASGEGRFTPQLTINFVDQTTQVVSHSFQIDNSKPDIRIGDIS